MLSKETITKLQTAFGSKDFASKEDKLLAGVKRNSKLADGMYEAAKRADAEEVARAHELMKNTDGITEESIAAWNRAFEEPHKNAEAVGNLNDKILNADAEKVDVFRDEHKGVLKNAEEFGELGLEYPADESEDFEGIC